jgi:hypothetical protein
MHAVFCLIASFNSEVEKQTRPAKHVMLTLLVGVFWRVSDGLFWYCVWDLLKDPTFNQIFSRCAEGQVSF